MATTLAPPTPSNAKPRRMTSPSLPPPAPLDLPEPVHNYQRPPSPLRQSFIMDPRTGELSDTSSTHESVESRQWGNRSHSPSPSVAKFAANIAQRVGSLMSQRSHLPTDDELEAEAEREREQSRREAERIMMQEALDRQTVEERVLAMLHGDGPTRPLPTPSRSYTTPPNPPSPSSSQKEGGGWWAVAKNKLTPTKEPLTPAQQIIQETKQREKEIEKDKKKSDKLKRKSKEWPASPDTKYEDPAFVKLGMAAASATPITPPRPIPSRPSSAMSSSPTQFTRAVPSTPPSLAASPARTGDVRAPPPLYAQFDIHGTLDVPGTLLTIAKRFEKLEKWTVGHVRALEERMDDVERWLVEKEKTRREKGLADDGASQNSNSADAIDELREEVAELQGRLSEMGREMAKMITAPGNLSSGPSRNSASINRAPSATSSVAVRSMSVSSPNAPQITSPTSTPPKVVETPSPQTGNRSSRTRLPYPTGDYATPPETALLGQGPFSPPTSPPPSLSSRPRTSISGLPAEIPSAGVSPVGLPRPRSPVTPGSPSPSLPPPNPSAFRQSSMSPTPRKRYTVALGGPIMSASRAEREREEIERPQTPHSRGQSRSGELSTAFFSSSPVSAPGDMSEDEESDGANEETIGKAAARHSGLSIPNPDSGRPTFRARPQSMYNGNTSHNVAAPTPTTPLRVRMRSQSTDRINLDIADRKSSVSSAASGKFVDPLVVRRQTKEELARSFPNPPKVMPGKPKVPVNQLVAYFDQDKRR